MPVTEVRQRPASVSALARALESAVAPKRRTPAAEGAGARKGRERGSSTVGAPRQHRKRKRQQTRPTQRVRKAKNRDGDADADADDEDEFDSESEGDTRTDEKASRRPAAAAAAAPPAASSAAADRGQLLVLRKRGFQAVQYMINPKHPVVVQALARSLDHRFLRYARCAAVRSTKYARYSHRA